MVVLRDLTTINLQLSSWIAGAGSPEFGPAVRRVNIRWTKPGPLVRLRDAIPSREAWKAIQVINMAQVGSSSMYTSDAVPSPIFSAIPETTVPYRTLSVRASHEPHRRVHVRVTKKEDRELILCGLQSATVAGIIVHIPGSELSAAPVIWIIGSMISRRGPLIIL